MELTWLNRVRLAATAAYAEIVENILHETSCGLLHRLNYQMYSRTSLNLLYIQLIYT